jgi:cob(I)alamin adenosyltransferase
MGEKPKIYTKTGDDGTTGLFGGSRVSKNDDRLEAYGTLDELNSFIGLIRSVSADNEINEILLFIQDKLFVIGAILASDEIGKQYTSSLVCSEGDVQKLEESIDLFEKELPELRQFILPGGNMLSSYCHIARTVCRRGERRMIKLQGLDIVPPNSLKFINRLSDFLFVLSRKTAFDGHSEETYWVSK